jgi:hypothetical protein
MKKRFLFILLLYSSFIYSQLPTVKDNKLIFSAVVHTDSAIVRGYLWHVSDSVVFISPYKKLNSLNQPTSLMTFNADNIRFFTVKRKKIDWGLPVAGAILGFVLGAGLTVNDDVDNDGETSFFELMISAVEGSTSRNRARRNTALFVGLGGGLAGFGIGLFAGRGLTVRLPLFARKKGLKDQRSMIENFINGN